MNNNILDNPDQKTSKNSEESSIMEKIRNIKKLPHIIFSTLAIY